MRKLKDIIDIDLKDLEDMPMIPHEPIFIKKRTGIKAFYGWKKEGDEWVEIASFYPARCKR